MKHYIIQFYDANESGNVEHNEVYTSKGAALRRFDFLRDHLNGYSWVYLYDGMIDNGRLRTCDCIEECRSGEGDDDWYHGDDCDF